jgi:hypothetical protein
MTQVDRDYWGLGSVSKGGDQRLKVYVIISVTDFPK